jgi:6-phosphofructokinase 2
VLVSKDRVLRAAPVEVKPVSAVGAGDSFLGTLVWGLAAGHGIEDAFRRAVAAGAAALLNSGTELCRPADVERLAAEVVLTAA